MNTARRLTSHHSPPKISASYYLPIRAIVTPFHPVSLRLLRCVIGAGSIFGIVVLLCPSLVKRHAKRSKECV